MNQVHYKLAQIISSVAVLTLGLLCAFPCLAQNVESKSLALKADILNKARGMRAQNGSRIKDINQRLTQIVEESQAANLDEDVNRLKTTLKEHLERQEFWDRVIFQIDTRFVGGDIREFLQSRLVEMAKVEASSPSSENLWKVFRYTADVLKSLPERKDDVIAVIEGYVRSTNPADPANPSTYLSQQNYTNGTHSETARTMSKEEVGELAERRLQQLDATQAAQAAQPAAPAPAQEQPAKTQ
jgi:hypothetical protein